MAIETRVLVEDVIDWLMNKSNYTVGIRNDRMSMGSLPLKNPMADPMYYPVRIAEKYMHDADVDRRRQAARDSAAESALDTASSE